MSSFTDHRLGGGNLNGDMSSVPLSDSELIYAGFGGGHGHDDLSQQLVASTSPVLSDGNAQDLDAETKETVTTKKGDRGEKAATALKNHSEAERRRRERINAHLATLRGMVPCTDKMDKAALLAEVITHVKKLKTSAAQLSSECPAVPADADEVTVELAQDSSPSSSSHAGVLIKATMSCEDGSDLFAEVKKALRPLRLRVVGSEVTTLGGRVRFTFLVSPCAGAGDVVSVVDSVHQALQAVIDKASSALEFAPRASLLNKRRRVSTFESSSSSS